MGASFVAASKATTLLSNPEWDAPLIGCSGHPRKIRDFASNNSEQESRITGDIGFGNGEDEIGLLTFILTLNDC